MEEAITRVERRAGALSDGQLGGWQGGRWESENTIDRLLGGLSVLLFSCSWHGGEDGWSVVAFAFLHGVGQLDRAHEGREN